MYCILRRQEQTVKIQSFSYIDGKKVLEKKGLLSDFDEIFESVDFEDTEHSNIQSLFEDRGWEMEKTIFKDKQWKWDLYKDKVAVSIEFSLIDAIQRDMLRAILLRHQNEIDCLVLITRTAVVATHFENIKSQIELFAPILNFPIYLIGMEI